MWIFHYHFTPDIVSEPANKAAMYIFRSFYFTIISHYHTGTPSFTVLEHESKRGFLIYKKTAMKYILDKKTMELVEAGLTDFWILQNTKYNVDFKVEEIGPQVSLALVKILVGSFFLSFRF